MATVPEQSLITIFIVGLVIALIMLVITIFYYNQFRSVEDGDLEHKDILLSKNLSLVFAVLAVIGIAILVVLFFTLPRHFKHKHHHPSHHHTSLSEPLTFDYI